jgi:hypothetical protein
MGRVSWQELIKAQYHLGYDSALNIEHGEPNWEGSVAKAKQGFLIARRFLQGNTA